MPSLPRTLFTPLLKPTSLNRHRNASTTPPPTHGLAPISGPNYPPLRMFPVPRAPNSQDPNPIHQNINHPYRQFEPPAERPKVLGGDQRARRETVLSSITGMPGVELRNLRRSMVCMKRVVNMTKKGRVRSYLSYVIVGDPERGLVGLGRGHAPLAPKATDAAFHQAVLNMDYVNRYEGRTVWGQGADLQGKFGASVVRIRARPPGFGLMVPASIHRVLTACGIRDASADIERSTEPVTVMKCVIQMLHAGANPPGFGDGFGHAGKRNNKGKGARSKEDLERARGRYGVDIGRRV